MERRVYKRYESAIKAKILVNKAEGATARVLDLSAGGLCFAYDGAVEIGDDIIAHMDGGARLEGAVVRVFDGGFAVSLTLSESRRAQLSKTLERLRDTNTAFDRLTLDRRIESRRPGGGRSVICETDQGAVEAQIIDMSLAGVGIETKAELALDSLVVIGRMRGQVVRREGDIYGIMFLSGEDQRQARYCSHSPDACGGPAECEPRHSACGFSSGGL